MRICRYKHAQNSPKDEIESIESILPTFTKKEARQFFTMIRGPKGLRLVQVLAQDDGYPFFGGLELEDKSIYPLNTPKLKPREALISPELKIQLGIRKNESFQIGEETFIAKDFVANDLSQSFSSFRLAPIVYISLNDLENTQLIQLGSVVQKAKHYKFDQATQS